MADGASLIRPTRAGISRALAPQGGGCRLGQQDGSHSLRHVDEWRGVAARRGHRLTLVAVGAEAKEEMLIGRADYLPSPGRVKANKVAIPFGRGTRKPILGQRPHVAPNRPDTRPH
jgi:hypothetical protein